MSIDSNINKYNADNYRNNMGRFSNPDVFGLVLKTAFKMDEKVFENLSHTCRGFAILVAKYTDPTANDHSFFIRACMTGCYFTIKAWEEAKENLNLSFNNNLPLRLVCRAEGKKYGFAESDYNRILKTILEHSKRDLTINPICDNNYCIRSASENGNALIVRTLINDGRSDPTDNGQQFPNDTLYLACLNGHYEVVDALLENSEVVVPAGEEGRPDKNIELQELPKRRHSFDPLKNYAWALLAACEMNHSKIVARLLRHPKIDPRIYGSAPIHAASKHGSLEVAQLLLEDGRVDPSSDSNIALRYAFANKDNAMRNLLLSSKRVLLTCFLDYNTWIRDVPRYQ